MTLPIQEDESCKPAPGASIFPVCMDEDIPGGKPLSNDEMRMFNHFNRVISGMTAKTSQMEGQGNLPAKALRKMSYDIFMSGIVPYFFFTYMPNLLKNAHDQRLVDDTFVEKAMKISYDILSNDRFADEAYPYEYREVNFQKLQSCMIRFINVCEGPEEVKGFMTEALHHAMDRCIVYNDQIEKLREIDLFSQLARGRLTYKVSPFTLLTPEEVFEGIGNFWCRGRMSGRMPSSVPINACQQMLERVQAHEREIRERQDEQRRASEEKARRREEQRLQEEEARRQAEKTEALERRQREERAARAAQNRWAQQTARLEKYRKRGLSIEPPPTPFVLPEASQQIMSHASQLAASTSRLKGPAAAFLIRVVESAAGAFRGDDPDIRRLGETLLSAENLTALAQSLRIADSLGLPESDPPRRNRGPNAVLSALCANSPAAHQCATSLLQDITNGYLLLLPFLNDPGLTEKSMSHAMQLERELNTVQSEGWRQRPLETLLARRAAEAMQPRAALSAYLNENGTKDWAQRESARQRDHRKELR